MKAIVMTCDRYRALTQHMILQYERAWPKHPFVFMVPYQNLPGTDTERTKYLKAPEDIPSSVLQLLADVDDEEWVYWCADDKYPIRLVTDKITKLFSYVSQVPKMSGLLFCRCRMLLGQPELALYPDEWSTPFGDILLERRAWYQIWIHQFVRAKVLRYFFSQMPEHIPGAKAMDTFKSNIAKLAEHRLFVTKENFAVFGESTQGGVITRNCFDSIRKTNIELPQWFQHPGRERVTMGKL
jgi:hypothetical protein